MLSKKITSFSALVLSGLLFATCDVVDQPLQNPTVTEVDCPTPTFPANTNTQRTVLLEEFTGHKCGPCPGAAKVARDLQTAYELAGKDFIVVSIHAGSLAIPNPVGDPDFTTDFRTTDGDYIANSLFTPALPYTPVGYINRVKVAGSPWIDNPDWQANADLEFAKPLEANLQMIVDYDSVANKGCAFVQTEYETSLTGDYYLVVYITEDSVVDWQTNGSTGDPAYPLSTDVASFYHRHVFRDAITPVLGVSVSSGTVAAGQQFINGITFSLNSAWHKKHIAFVAYIYNNATKEILQACEHHLE